MYNENEDLNETKSIDLGQNQPQEQIKKQKTIGQLAKQIDKLEKEIAKLEAQLNKKYEQLEQLKSELKSVL